MKLLSMKLENFRQFYGVQQFEFATGEKQNVTVFHGYNGAGKTALLNSFVWCLYGTTSSDLEASDRMCNERVVAMASPGQELEVSVCLTFERASKRYFAERRQVGVRGENSVLITREPTFRLMEVGPSGELESSGASPQIVQNQINQMLPQELYPFFFFNGERVEKLAGVDAYDQVESGIKTLLDVEIFERSCRHLRQVVSKSLGSELKELSVDEEHRKALSREQELLEQQEEQRERIKQQEANVAALQSEISRFEEEQAAIEELSDLIKERDQLRKEMQLLKESLAGIDNELARCLSTDGYLAFGERLFATTENLVAQARQRGELPAKLKPQFVDDLLDRHLCICGRSIDEDSAEQQTLVDWRKSTGLAEFEVAIQQTYNAVAPFRHRRNEYLSSVARQQSRKATLQKRLRATSEALAAIQERTGDRELGEEAIRLHMRLQKLNNDLPYQIADLKRYAEKLEEIGQELAAVRGIIESLVMKNERTSLLQRQKSSVDHLADVLDEISVIRQEAVRTALDAQIQETWSQTAIKGYRARVTEGYRLSLTKMVGDEEQPVFGASTGEKQVLALSFVASLVSQAGLELKESEDGFTTGGDYPLVMDSPFGALEDDYRRNVAEWVPTLANQVVVMVSKTQWRDEVESAIAERIGKQYVLELHTAKRGSDRKIHLNGRDFPYVVSSHDPSEWTEIRDVAS